MILINQMSWLRSASIRRHHQHCYLLLKAVRFAVYVYLLLISTIRTGTSRIRYMMMMILLCSCIRCRSIRWYIMLEFRSWCLRLGRVSQYKEFRFSTDPIITSIASVPITTGWFKFVTDPDNNNNNNMVLFLFPLFLVWVKLIYYFSCSNSNDAATATNTSYVRWFCFYRKVDSSLFWLLIIILIWGLYWCFCYFG